jgi:NhaP-type Na+/H+ or K+/H+ antiporter
MIWKCTLLLIATSLASDAEDEQQDEEASEPAYAVLFPAWALTLGVVAFYVLSRYARALPYTAVMFLLGTIMGIIAELGDFEDHMGDSIRLWTGINSEVLLLVFLPGLLFRDAMAQNVHLFVYSINQLLIFAFPMVLAGTVLTALVAYYIFPYDWPFNLAMAFGSILSATDPVAVAALLEEVGAPPRLKVHIAGESLLNDGAAIVFFSIFYQKYLFEDLKDIGGAEHGENVDIAKGFVMFFQKAVGGFAVGLMFGIGQLIILFVLDRRVSREENIVQVTSIIGMAYLNFYTADFVWHTSGVISTVTAGLIVKLFGGAAVNGTLQVFLDS